MTPPDANLWTVVEASQYLRLPRRSVYRLVEHGVVPHLRIGRRLRFNPIELREYVARTCRGGVPRE